MSGMSMPNSSSSGLQADGHRGDDALGRALDTLRVPVATPRVARAVASRVSMAIVCACVWLTVVVDALVGTSPKPSTVENLHVQGTVFAELKHAAPIAVRDSRGKGVRKEVTVRCQTEYKSKLCRFDRARAFAPRRVHRKVRLMKIRSPTHTRTTHARTSAQAPRVPG